MDSLERRLRERIEALSPADRDRLAEALGADGPGELVAVIRALGDPPPEDELRSHVRSALPDYMVPRRFVFVDELPRTRAGKLDRKALAAGLTALPEPTPGSNGTADGISAEPVDRGRPRTEAEKTLAGIWASVLGSDEIFLDDDFFELGGDSLLSIRVIARAKQAGLEIDPRQFFATPTIAALAAAAGPVDDAEPSDGEMGEAGGETRPAEAARAPVLPTRSESRAPLSFAQEGFWFLDRLDPGNPAYNVAVRIDLEGPVDPERLARSAADVFRRHDALRGTVRLDEGVPWLDALPTDEFTLERVDYSDLPEPEARVAALARETARHRFDLLGGPLARGILARLSPDRHALLLAFHHMVLDGESVRLVLEELGEGYATGPDETGPGRKAEAGVSYRDYAAWERARWKAAALAGESLDYWSEALSDLPERIEWPLDGEGTGDRGPGGSTVRVTLDPEIAEGVDRLCSSLGCTPFVLLLSVYQLLLHRHSGQDVVCVGTPVAHRPHPALERAVGYFQNMVPLRSELSGDLRFGAFVARTRDAVAGALAHADVPFERIVEAVTPHRNRADTPLFQTAFTFRDETRSEGWRSALSLPEVGVSAAVLHNGAAKFELAFEIERTDAGLDVVAEFAERRFAPETVSILLSRFETLLRGVVAEPDDRVAVLPVMTPEERSRTLGAWSEGPRPDPGRDAPLASSVVDRIEVIAADDPDRIAVSDPTGSLTYGELLAQADVFAGRLRDRSLAPEALVAVALPPSMEQVVAILGTWRAGGAFLALDPTHPPERLRAILDDAGPALVVCAPEAVHPWIPEDVPVVRGPARGRSVSLSAPGASNGARPPAPVELDSESVPRTDPDGSPSPSSLAYVIYTSGSTGTPKGVEVEHRSLTNLAEWHRDAFEIGPDDRASQVASSTFDASVWETWVNLGAGATLVIAPPEVRIDPRELRSWLAREKITAAFAPTPVAEVLLRDGPLPDTVRLLFSGGAQIRTRPPEACTASVINCYGPAECTVISVAGPVEAGDAAGLPGIGRPIRATRVFVLDRQGQPVPPGVAGELCIAGAGLARGYRHDDEKTRGAFREAEFPEAAGIRLYHTGDQARFRPDGTLAFLGRRDRQIKIRGQRIELAEVEAALLATPGVEQGAVAVMRDGMGEPRLVAFVAGPRGAGTSGALDGEGVRRGLLERLPSAMVPSQVRPVPELPLNASGKVDRRALERMQTDLDVREPPEGGTERLIAAAWTAVLGTEEIGRHDDFFHLGGHSLNAIAVLVRLESTFGVELPLTDFFDSPTVAGLAAVVDSFILPDEGPEDDPGDPGAEERADGTGRYPLSPDQARLWYLQQLEPDSPAYNIPLVYRLEGRLDGSALQVALDGLAARHDALRVRVDGQGDEPVQVISPPTPVHLARTELPSDTSVDALDEAIRREASIPFDLQSGPLMRARLFHRGSEEHHLVLTLHHLVGDGWSAGLLARELSRAYGESLEPDGRVPRDGPGHRQGPEDGTGSPPEPPRWGPWCAAQRAWLDTPQSRAELSWWKDRLADVPPLELPTDHPRPRRPTYRGRTHTFRLSRTDAEGLEERCRRAGVTPFAGLLAGFTALLHRYAGQRDVAVGTVVAGRRTLVEEEMVGLFANTLVVRTDVDPEEGVDDLLARVGRNAVEALGHQRVPFGQVVEAVQPPRDPSRNPLFQVAFLLQNQASPPLDLPGLRAVETPVDTGTAKFDLTLSARRDEDGYALFMEYATDLFEPATIGRMSAHLGTVLTAMARGFAGTVATLPLVLDRVEWSLVGPVRAPSGEPLHVRVSEQARRTPDAVAVTGEDGSTITYRELDIRSHRIAVALVARGVGAGDVVGVGLPRSPDLVAALLGILKAGAAYLPLDPEFPTARLEHIAGDADAAFLLTTRELETRFPPELTPVRLTTLLGDTVPGAEDEVRPDAPDFPMVAPESLAYLIYTSGSTGGPKGVEITHGNAVNLLDTMAVRPGLDGRTRWLAVTTLSFDISVLEIFGPLVAGGEVVLASTDTAADGGALSALISRVRPTHLQATPSTWRMLLDSGWEGDGSLRALVGGEALPPELARELAGPCAEVWNMYGPTETTVWSTCGRVDEGEGPIQVGSPVANTTIYVLDDHLQPAPMGVTGELYIAGAGVSRGYRGRPGLTEERFVPDPFAERDRPMYRTGDRVRRLPGGTLEVLGRLDGQVKIRGYRIETGEVEAVLERHPAVRRAAVRAFETGTPDARLVAFVVRDPDHDVSGSELRRFARERLPRYMVPSMISLLDELPVTPNGKVDRKALEDPLASSRVDVAPHQVPATEAQKTIAEVWGDLLPGVRVGRSDNFFELGGHSLLSIRAVAEIRRRTGRELDPRAFFFQSVEQLAAELEDDGGPE